MKDLNPEEARSIQRRRSGEVVQTGRPNVRTVCGIRVSSPPPEKVGLAGAVTVQRTTHQVLDRSVLLGDLERPYEPGLLGFREGPLIERLVNRLDRRPDLLLVHGHGVAHPRGFGLASRVGVNTGIPTLGCAKNTRVGEGEVPGSAPGDHTILRTDEPVGYVYRSLEGAEPIYLSVGHGFEPEVMLDWLPDLLYGRERLPVPLGEAGRLARTVTRRFRQLTESLPEENDVHLVGGALRRLLTGRVPNDYDVVVRTLSEQDRRNLKQTWGGNWFTLDSERGHYRFTGNPELDVKVLGDTPLRDDLLRRDFTVNAVALALREHGWTDPADGREDLENGILRPVSEDVLRRDPVRILRAIRFQFDQEFELTPDFREEMHSSVPLLDEVPRERILEELFDLFELADPSSVVESLGRIDLFRLDRFEEPDPDRLRGIQTRNSIVTDGFGWKESVHGSRDWTVVLMTALLIPSSDRSSWPLNRQVVRRIGAVEKGYDQEDLPEVLASRDRWYGWLLGRGIGSGWSADRFQRTLNTVDEFLRRRESMEKRIVSRLRAEDVQNLGVEKNRRLRKRLSDSDEFHELRGLVGD